MTRQQLPNTSSSSLPRASSIETTSFRLSNESKYSHNPTSANNGGHYYPNQIPTAATATTPSIHQRFLEDCASTTNYSSTTAGTSENLPLSLQNNHLQQSITSSSSTALLSSHHHHHHNREESTSSSSVVACDNHNRIQADNKKQQHPKKLQRITSKTHRYQSLTSALNPSIINPLPSSPKQHQAGYYSSSGTRQSYNSNYSFDINGSPYSRSNSNASTAAAATGSGPVNMSTKGIIPTTNTNSNSPSNTNDGNTTTSTPYPPPAPTVAGGGVTSATSMAFTATSPGFSGRSPISAHAVNHRRTFSTTADGSRNSAGGGQHQSDGGDPFWYIYKRNGKRKRMYQVYHPNYGWHPFGGRSHTGRKPIPFITGVVLIILPTVGFCIVVAPYIWHNFSIAPIIILIYMFLVSMSSMFMASFSDPGIIPRNLDAVYDPDTFAITPRPYNQPQSQTTGIPGAQGSSSLQGAAGGATSPSVDSQENVNNTDRFKNMTSEDVDKLLSDYVSLPPPYIELETPSQSSSNLYTKASPSEFDYP
ncbi:Eukaryotic peptide chain release factor GTP-binding subunit [Mycoemilia scoparia]|uniref:Eukaryotic peptide chain release factor GTP-binding subunit n=1 Tax=Mycoemilia scoparia TaxID=417184 RepID=A0A9W8DQH4_9FUNG|nr:Eukaryotic peptide chain release factor GTP-binding subunit [Mycoemilia scoparia]